MPNSAASAVMGETIHPGFPPAAGIAAFIGARSFSLLLKPVFARLRQFVGGAPAAPGCVLCAVKSSDRARLAKIVASLPVGKKITLPKLSAIVNMPYGALDHDLNRLRFDLRLPIKKTRHGILLTEPVRLCENCARKPRPHFWTNWRKP